MSTRDFINESINTHKVCMFSETSCSNCSSLKKHLKDNGITFTPIELDQRSDRGEDLKKELRNITGHRTVPQVFVKGQFIGGADDIFSWSNDELKRKLQCS